jgi:hypothetical protein
MGKILIGLGVFILLSLIVFPMHSIDHLEPQIGSIGFGANSNYPIAPDEVRKAIDRANDIAGMQNENGITYASYTKLLLQSVVVFGALISFCAGFQRILKANKKSDTLVIVAIALFGASSAISTSYAGHFQKRADHSFGCVDKIEENVRDTLKDIESETNTDLAKQYLVEMKREIERCDSS